MQWDLKTTKDCNVIDRIAKELHRLQADCSNGPPRRGINSNPNLFGKFQDQSCNPGPISSHLHNFWTINKIPINQWAKCRNLAQSTTFCNPGSDRYQTAIHPKPRHNCQAAPGPGNPWQSYNRGAILIIHLQFLANPLLWQQCNPVLLKFEPIQLNCSKIEDHRHHTEHPTQSHQFHSPNLSQLSHNTIYPILPQSTIPSRSPCNSWTRPPGYIELGEVCGRSRSPIAQGLH